MNTATAQHTPFRPARADMAEASFLALWRSLNSDLPDLLPTILGTTRCEVRSARVAASFITWIGSSAGAAFIEQAKARIEEFCYPEPAYLATWALVNRRQKHLNSGVRAIEVILSSQNLFDRAGAHYLAQKRASTLAISLSDLDVVESMVVWLSTSQGDAFVSACVADYQAKKALHSSRQDTFNLESE